MPTIEEKVSEIKERLLHVKKQATEVNEKILGEYHGIKSDLVTTGEIAHGGTRKGGLDQDLDDMASTLNDIEQQINETAHRLYGEKEEYV